MLEARFKEDLGADSLAMAELAMVLEEEFKVTIDDEQVADLLTVDDAVRYLQSVVPQE